MLPLRKNRGIWVKSFRKETAYNKSVITKKKKTRKKVKGLEGRSKSLNISSKELS